MLRLYFVEKIPALASQKRVNKAIHPQSPIKYAREVKMFLPMVFQMGVNGFSNGRLLCESKHALEIFCLLGNL